MFAKKVIKYPIRDSNGQVWATGEYTENCGEFELLVSSLFVIFQYFTSIITFWLFAVIFALWLFTLLNVLWWRIDLNHNRPRGL